MHRPHAEATPASQGHVAVRVHARRAGRGAARAPCSRRLTRRRSLTGHGLTCPFANRLWWLRATGGPEWPWQRPSWTAKQKIVSALLDKADGPRLRTPAPSGPPGPQPGGQLSWMDEVLAQAGPLRWGWGWASVPWGQLSVGVRRWDQCGASPWLSVSSASSVTPQQGFALPFETWVWNRGSEGMFVAQTERRGEGRERKRKALSKRSFTL